MDSKFTFDLIHLMRLINADLIHNLFHFHSLEIFAWLLILIHTVDSGQILKIGSWKEKPSTIKERCVVILVAHE